MAFQFKIQLKDITDPPVWRRVLVPEQFTFLRMHKVIQAAFGWQNSHLFEFSTGDESGGSVIGEPHPEFEYQVKDCKKIKLNNFFTVAGQKIIYIYDFGDGWEHEITLEKITDEKILRAVCQEGGGACPPEDCGGPSGYENLKLIVDDTMHPEHDEMKEWLGLDENQ